MMDTGSTICIMAMEWKDGTMDQCTKDITLLERKIIEECIIGLEEIYIKATGKMEKWKDMVFILLKMAKGMQATFHRT